MSTYATLEESLQTKKAVEVRRVETHPGRFLITAKKANGKKTYTCTLYENNRYSKAV